MPNLEVDEKPLVGGYQSLHVNDVQKDLRDFSHLISVQNSIEDIPVKDLKLKGN